MRTNDFKIGDIVYVGCGNPDFTREYRVIKEINDTYVLVKVIGRWEKPNKWGKFSPIFSDIYDKISKDLFYEFNTKVEKDSELMCQVFVNLML